MNLEFFQYIKQRKKNVINAVWCAFNGGKLYAGISPADGEGIRNCYTE